MPAKPSKTSIGLKNNLKHDPPEVRALHFTQARRHRCGGTGKSRLVKYTFHLARNLGHQNVLAFFNLNVLISFIELWDGTAHLRPKAGSVSP